MEKLFFSGFRKRKLEIRGLMNTLIINTYIELWKVCCVLVSRKFETFDVEKSSSKLSVDKGLK